MKRFILVEDSVGNAEALGNVSVTQDFSLRLKGLNKLEHAISKAEIIGLLDHDTVLKATKYVKAFYNADKKSSAKRGVIDLDLLHQVIDPFITRSQYDRLFDSKGMLRGESVLKTKQEVKAEANQAILDINKTREKPLGREEQAGYKLVSWLLDDLYEVSVQPVASYTQADAYDINPLITATKLKDDSESTGDIKQLDVQNIIAQSNATLAAFNKTLKTDVKVDNETILEYRNIIFERDPSKRSLAKTFGMTVVPLITARYSFSADGNEGTKFINYKSCMSQLERYLSQLEADLSKIRINVYLYTNTGIKQTADSSIKPDSTVVSSFVYVVDGDILQAQYSEGNTSGKNPEQDAIAECITNINKIFTDYADVYEYLASRTVKAQESFSVLKEEYVLHDRPSRNYYVQNQVPTCTAKCLATDKFVDEIPDTAEIEGITLVIKKDDKPVTFIGFDPDLPYSLDSMYTKQTEFAEEADADELNNWLKTNLTYWYKK